MAKAMRYNVQESAQQAPGHCFLCRGVKGPFINTGMSVQFQGVVIFCFTCVEELSGYLPQEEVKPIIKKVDYDYIDRLVGSIVASVDSLAGTISLHGLEKTEQVHSGSNRELDESSNGNDKAVSGEGALGIPSDSDGGVEFPELTI